MALPEIQQIRDAIKKSEHILITFAKEFSVDGVASAMALSLALKKLGKLCDVACDSFTPPPNIKFLPGVDSISPFVKNLQRFIITVNVAKDAVEEFSYDLEEHKLKIYLTPKSGTFKPDDVSSGSSDFKYDLIITLDSPDLDSLGSVYQQAAEFFFATTIINIDHKPSNEQFGQVNLTNPNACATAELTYDLISELDDNLIDKEIATCLLTGLIAKTRSFKTITVTPTALEIASRLLQLGADQTAIIKALYRSRSLATMNVWGRVLARLRSHDRNTLVWSLINQNDFVESSASPEDLPDVIDELIAFVPGVEVVVLLFQQNGSIGVLLKVLKNHNALFLTKSFQPQGNKEIVRFTVADKTLVEAEKLVIDQIKQQLSRTA